MKIYKVWARIEVMDTETEEHDDLNPDLCEYKIGEFEDIKDVALFINSQNQHAQGDVLGELEHAMEWQFGEGER